MRTPPVCESCAASMSFKPKLSFDDAPGSYVMHRCMPCDKEQVVPVDDLMDEHKAETARMSLEVMRVLQSMTLDETRELVAEMNAKLKKCIDR